MINTYEVAKGHFKKEQKRLENRRIADRHCRVRCLSAYEYYQKKGYQGAFLTLTYADEHLPEKPTPKHINKFFKDFCRAKKISRPAYFYSSESGDENGRLHWHILIFNWSYTASHEVAEAWSLGFVKIKSINPRRINYVVGYQTKYGHNDIKHPRRFSNHLPHCYSKQEISQMCRRGYCKYNGAKYSVPIVFRSWFKEQWSKFAPARYCRFYKRVLDYYPKNLHHILYLKIRPTWGNYGPLFRVLVLKKSGKNYYKKNVPVLVPRLRARELFSV